MQLTLIARISVASRVIITNYKARLATKQWSVRDTDFSDSDDLHARTRAALHRISPIGIYHIISKTLYAPRPRTHTIHIAQESSLSTSISTITIKMEETATPGPTAVVAEVEKQLPVFRYPTPSLEYLADTKQSDIYKSLGMDRGRKNLLVNSLYWPYPLLWGREVNRACTHIVVRIIHRKVLSQNTSWRDIDMGLKQKAIIQLFEEEEKDERELVSWLRGFEGNWILHYLFRRRHTTYLDGLRRLEKQKRIRGWC